MSKAIGWIAVAGGVLAALPAVCVAQLTEGRPVRVLVASAPGGPSDIQARLLTPTLFEVLQRTVVVDNRPSANGVLATEIASKATPDGHTLAVGNSGTHAVNATLYKRLAYDPIKDFVPISQFSTTGMVVAANAKLPGTSIKDLVAAAKPNPGKYNIAVAGATGELAGDALWHQIGIKMTNVRYKGSAPSTQAVLSGEAHISLLTPLAAKVHIRAGRMKAYGITSSARSPVLPEVPTMQEQGVTGYDVQFWNGMFAPAGTPKAVVDTVHRAIVTALKKPDVKKRFDELGLIIVGSSPQEFAKVVQRDVAKFRKTIIDSGIPRL